MQRYKKIMVGLSLSNDDEYIVSYTAMVAQMAKAKKVEFMHVLEALDIPEEIMREYPALLDREDAEMRVRMKDMAEKHFKGLGEISLTYTIAEGSPLLEILRRSREQDFDLIVVGKRRKSERSNIQEKLVRKGHCSILIVPEKSKPILKKILVPVDFSSQAHDAVDVATAFGNACTKPPQIFSLYTYNIPTGYFKTGKSHQEFANIMRGNAKRKYEDFIQSADLKGLSITPIFRQHSKPPEAIYETAKKRKVDLVVKGAKGKTDTAAVLLGSITEQLIRTLEVPLMAIKKKGETTTLLDALLSK